MPNHCENDLYISGSTEDVQRLLAHIGADRTPLEFDFSTIIPYPEQFAKLDRDSEELGRVKFEERYGENAKDGFNSGGYEWRVKEWGTKWGAYEVVRRDYGGICLTFQTAWSPPTPVIVALHKLFQNVTLSLEFFERGGAFCGGFICQSREDWYDREDGTEWAPGLKTNDWEGEYRGTRGG